MFKIDLTNKVNSRLGRVLSSGMAGVISRGIAMISPLVTIPMTLAHLGQAGFGLWMAIASLTTLLAFADLGLGNTILSDISRANARGDHRAIKVILSTTYGCICLICLALLPLAIVVAHSIDWTRQLGITDVSVASQASPSIMIAAVLFIAGVPAALIYKIQIAFQKAFVANLWQAAGSLVGMGLIIASVKAKLSLLFIVASFFGGPVLVWLVNTAWFFGITKRDVRPSLGAIDVETFRKLVKQSAEFFVLSITLTLATSLDTFLVSKFSGLENAAKFAIALRVSALLSLVPMMMYMPLWAANGEAIGRGDYDWVRRTVFRMTGICALITALMGAAILASSDLMFELWLKSKATIPSALLYGLFAWAILQAVASPRFMALNSLVIVRPQIWMHAAFLLVSVPMKIVVLKNAGLVAMPWVNCAVYVCLVVPALELIYRRSISPKHIDVEAMAPC